MDIVSYLRELIETRKNVGINALGTLFKKKIPGRYDSETHSFLPPKYEIAFTDEVKEPQYLINFISEKRNISTESASYYVNEFAEHIKAQLDDHQEADFSPIGQLKLVNDEIVLVSLLEIGSSSFGLPIISALPNQSATKQEDDEIVAKEIVAEETPDEIVEPSSVEEVISAPPTDILDPLWKPTVINRYEYDEDEDEEEKGGWFAFALKAIVVILIILSLIGTIIYFVYPDVFQTFKGKFTTTAPMDNEPIVMVDTSTHPKIDTTKADTLQKSPIIAPKKDTILTPKPVNKVVTYEVIGSAMKTQKKVDEVIANLAKRGITAKKMEALPGRLIKISLGTFTDFNLAKKQQDSLKIKLKNPDIYIQTIKPKN